MEKRGGELKERIHLLSKQQENRKRLAKLKRDTIRKADFLRKKAVIETHDVYNLIRGFFREFLEKRYEFTITELRKELRGVYISSGTRKMLDLVLEKLSAIEYANVHYKHDELVELIDVFKQTVDYLVKTHTKKKGLWAKLKGFLFKEDTDPEVIISELPATEKNDVTNIRLHLLVEKCYIALEGHNLKRAKTAYKALLGEYYQLSEEDKKNFYPLIDQTYLDIINRANSKN